MKPKLSTKERDLLEHATGWRSSDPLYRNYFAASQGSDDYKAWESLVTRGLASLFVPSNEEATIFPMHYFHVTPLGISALDGRSKGKRR